VVLEAFPQAGRHARGLPSGAMTRPTEPAVETLRRFVHNVEQLQTRRLLRDADLRSDLSLDWAEGGPLRVRHHEPDEEDLRSYLVDFRKFMAEREPVFLARVLSVARRHVTSDEIVAQLAAARSRWKEALKKGDFEIVVNEEQLRPETIMDLWIDGYYFHDDPEKRRKLDALAMVPTSRWFFIDSVLTATHVILSSGHVLKVALREGLVSETPVR
jgi:hypothetical protein